MRQVRTVERSIFEHYAKHEIGQELAGMSAWLDDHPDVLDWVADDLRQPVQSTGRQGLTCDSALRCALLKQHRQWSYDELAFHLEDSLSCQSFARLSTGWCPKRAALQRVVSAITDTTWERINQLLLKTALRNRNK